MGTLRNHLTANSSQVIARCTLEWNLKDQNNVLGRGSNWWFVKTDLCTSFCRPALYNHGNSHSDNFQGSCDTFDYSPRCSHCIRLRLQGRREREREREREKEREINSFTATLKIRQDKDRESLQIGNFKQKSNHTRHTNWSKRYPPMHILCLCSTKPFGHSHL